MKNIAGYLVGAVVLGILCTACLMLGLIDRDLVGAEQAIAAMHYGEAEAAFQKAERYFELASNVPGMSRGPLNTMRARAAALRYWQKDYAALIPRQNDPVTAIASDNVELQVITANAVFRAAQSKAKDRQTTMQALDAGINGYMVVLKNDSKNAEAAYNLEYLVRLRDDVEKGRKKPGFGQVDLTGLGSLGFPAKDVAETRTFKVLVPLDPEERNKMGNAGKAEPKGRKG